MIIGYIGLPGSGKSTVMAKIAQKAMKCKKYDRVYCNFYIDGCYKIDFDDLGRYNYENALILIDEAMNEADSRDFKKFTAEKKYFFSNHRHYKLDIIYFTQSYDDVDKKIRNLTVGLYHIQKFLWWTLITPIKQLLTIDDFSHQIVTGYKFKSIFTSRLCFRPFWYKYFDTHERKKLPPVPEYLQEQYTPLKPRKVSLKKPRKNKVYQTLRYFTTRVKRAYAAKKRIKNRTL